MKIELTKKLRLTRVCCTALLIALSGCTHLQSNDLNSPTTAANSSNSLSNRLVLPKFNTSLFGDNYDTIELEAITELTELQKQDFFDYYNDPINSNTAMHERLANYLTILLDQFQYSTDTKIASQTLSSFSGNCLSLALLTSAFADIAGVEVSYHLMGHNPVYSIENDLLVTSDHIRTVLKDQWHGDPEKSFRIQKNIRIDYFPTDSLKYVEQAERDFHLSTYYSNVAVEALSEEKLEFAFANANKALSVWAKNSSALNTMAILHRRLGDVASAEQIYQFNLENEFDSTTTLRNYITLLRQESRFNQAQKLATQLEEIESSNPWHWVIKAQNHETAGDYRLAVNAYKKAITLAPDLYQLHAYLAVSGYRADLPDLAKSHFKQAISLSKSAEQRNSYKGKLKALDR